NWEAEGQWQRGRLSLLTFFGEAKKVSGCRATPDLHIKNHLQNLNHHNGQRSNELSQSGKH
ncbi:hypothetical protein, partial [Undibacterium sp.]|uniref:hypothetical protein n=1 Tax=Undibacterium sp. TaxID=1914977 RepID=UPI0037525A21